MAAGSGGDSTSGVEGEVKVRLVGEVEEGEGGRTPVASRRDAEVKFSWSLKSLLLSILSSWSSVACKDLIRVEQCVFLLDPKPRTMFFGSLHHQVARFPLEKSPCCKMYLKRLFSPVVCVSWFLVVLVSLTEHNLVVSSSEIRSYVFLSEEVNISGLWGSQVSGLLRSREGIILRTIVTWMGPYKGLQDGGRHRNCCPPPSSCSSHQNSRQEALLKLSEKRLGSCWGWGIWKKSKYLLYVSNIIGKKTLDMCTFRWFWHKSDSFSFASKVLSSSIWKKVHKIELFRWIDWQIFDEKRIFNFHPMLVKWEFQQYWQIFDFSFNFSHKVIIFLTNPNIGALDFVVRLTQVQIPGKVNNRDHPVVDRTEQNTCQFADYNGFFFNSD